MRIKLEINPLQEIVVGFLYFKFLVPIDPIDSLTAKKKAHTGISQYVLFLYLKYHAIFHLLHYKL
jgi:hypothetical protein